MVLFGGGFQNPSPVHSSTNHVLGGIWGTSGSDVFAVGQRGTILQYDASDSPAMSNGAYG